MSIKLVGSGIDGRRHPFWSPTFLLMQVKRVPFHVAVGACRDFSQISPVLSSQTASLLNEANTTNRCAAGNTLSQFGGMPLRSITPAPWRPDHPPAHSLS